jgi:hypothetical protein
MMPGGGAGADGMGLPGDPGDPAIPGDPGDPAVGNPIDKAIADGDECDLISQQADNGKQPVDIIWAIDSSPSMTLVIDAMAMEMNKLVDTVTMADIDVHIVLITAEWKKDILFNNPIIGDEVVCVGAPTGSGSCPDDTNLPVYHHVAKECGGENGCSVGSHSALSKIISSYPHYMADLRPDSLKYFGAMTDDTAGDTMDFAAQAAQFTADVEGLMPGWFDDWTFFAIINPGLGGAYQMLADQTGGITGEINPLIMQDYSTLFNMLAVTVTNEVKLACDWVIPPVPASHMGEFSPLQTNFKYTPGDGSASPEVFKVKDAGACGMEHGWYYDNNDAPTKVVVCPKTCATVQPDLTGKIDILFGCPTVIRPE